ncbi:flavin reductase [Pseudomonas helleri]|uniref:flavin reductase n=1 Tax=Pseudomonas helleri TaxID=1608996 RepID=UPI003F9C20D6
MAMQNISFDPQAFRAALGTFTTGVTIITTQTEEGAPVGITANSFNSVSLNPPLVLWSLSKQARSLPVFSSGKHWNVHVLSTEQETLSGRFATQGEDKFAEIELDNGVSAAPLLQNCTARFQCRTAFQSGQYALATRKPRSELRLATTPPPPECSYTEDLLGYLLGRAHYQVLNTLRQLLNSKQLDEQTFFILSILCIRDNLTLEEINTFVSYTGREVTLASMRFLERQRLVAFEGSAEALRFVLTAQGREMSLHQLALAKAVEEDLSSTLGAADAQALKVLLKRLIVVSDPGLPDLWAPR